MTGRHNDVDTTHHRFDTIRKIPRAPLAGCIDLTYRCNNHCRHCWLWVPDSVIEKNAELTFSEIRSIVDEARSMGCRQWSISGGEPMLREDFPEIFDYITGKSARYSLNTNGTLITPEIARLLKRKGAKMVALYGATAGVHDHVTRNPGSFEAAMNGFSLLKEAGAGFIVQIIPMRDNYHQFDDMIKLAHDLSPHYRIGASYIHLSASGSPAVNREILKQRLSPEDVIMLDRPDVAFEENRSQAADSHFHSCKKNAGDRRLLAPCAMRNQFVIDPCGRMGFCSFIKDPKFLYDLRRGSFASAWDEFLPSLADMVIADKEYDDHCGACEKRSDCMWCPAAAYLEEGRYTAKVEFFCKVADEKRRFAEAWKKEHRRYYRVGGVTIRVESDLPITDGTFHEKLDAFLVEGPGDDNVSIRHHFSLPDIGHKDLGKEVYRRSPWSIYHKGRSWIYLGISPGTGNQNLHKVAVFNEGHTRGEIYNDGEEFYRKGGIHSLTMMPTDQILMTPLFADRQACIMHAAGMVLDGRGLLFVGHSEAGKSTTVTMLKDHGEILCDDRIVVRRWPDGFRIHGTWCHGTVPAVSPGSAPLSAILLIEKSPDNRLTRIADRREIVRKLPFYVVKSLVTPEWWDKTLSLIDTISREVPVYRLELDKSGRVAGVIKEITAPDAGKAEHMAHAGEFTS